MLSRLFHSNIPTFQQSNNRGFTLIECLVAIFLITFGVGGAMSVVNQTTAFTQVASSRLVAAYLAQEGIEIVRNIRDTNFLKIHKGIGGIDWNAGLTDCAGGCYNFDYRSQTIPDNLNCNGKNYLKFENDFYKCSLAPDSQNLQRKIIIQLESEPYYEVDILKVRVLVSWEERGRTHQVIAQENLYPWW